jgi:hypothetical protein
MRALATICISLILSACAAAPPSTTPAPAAAQDVDARVARLDSRPGFVPLHYDAASGRLFLEVTRLNEDLLFYTTLATGLGSTRALLDRGDLGWPASASVVRFERHGNRVLLIRRNVGVQGEGNEALRRSVEESFPQSVLASMPIEAQRGGRYLVDATSFLLGDLYDVAGQIRDAGLGTLRLDRERSYIDVEQTKAFPRNSEIRAVLTFTTDAPSAELRRLAPDGRSLTMQQHHTFFALPEPGFQPRAFDPRAGIFPVSFFDFDQPLTGDYMTRNLMRWRLEKRDPSAALSEPVQPIIYYLDPAVPEPYRTAFVEGGNWWNGVFEAAGFRNAFRVEPLPDGVDPMDARYNVILWVHRTERGPSVGPAIYDPRTGEILRAVVRMDSYRSLVNYSIFAGLRPALLAQYGSDWSAAGRYADAEALAMARRRQHMAHEIGHTLGLAHNFLAATQGRASVMDYPYPFIALGQDGRLDLSRTYREGGGAHDTLAIRYAYTQFATPAQEAAGLAAILADGAAQGLRFITGGDAGLSSSIPAATTWVEGETMLAALDRTMRVREVLLRHFDENAVRPGEPLSRLGDRLAHVYLHHRYALHGATKTIGGLEYGYALRGDGSVPTRVIPVAEQRRALDGVLRALAPGELAIPDRVTTLIPPAAWGYESPPLLAGGPLDPLALAHGLASEIVQNLLHRERAQRLVTQHARDRPQLGLDEVLTRLVAATWGSAAPAAAAGTPAAAEIRRLTQRAVLDGLIDLAVDERAAPLVRAAAERQLTLLHGRLAALAPADRAHGEQARRDIAWVLEQRSAPPTRSPARVVPLPWP